MHAGRGGACRDQGLGRKGEGGGSQNNKCVKGGGGHRTTCECKGEGGATEQHVSVHGSVTRHCVAVWHVSAWQCGTSLRGSVACQ